MTRAAAFVALAILIIGSSLIPPASAQIYRWTDEHGTVHFTEGLSSVPARYRSQAVTVSPRVAPSPPVAPPARGPSRETFIRFSPGRQIIVPALVNGSAACRLMLDTGAAATLISPRVLAAAGVSLAHAAPSVRARGLAKDAEVEVKRVFVDSLEVGEVRVDRLMVVAYDMDMPNMDGLLGQDFLALFNVSIDAGAGVVRLDPK
ncbi:MAG TPA: aspartyl protease family protein [Methylomirabilota bacterium]|nr:aspartyl protease family protein [Methylomirabilota bacterium]